MQKERGDNPCSPPKFAKEYDLGKRTGDPLCPPGGKILTVKKEEVRPQVRLGFEEGDIVRITSGPFALVAEPMPGTVAGVVVWSTAAAIWSWLAYSHDFTRLPFTFFPTLRLWPSTT